MNRIIARSSSVAYRRIIKPTLFHFAPDDVHARLVASAQVAQSFQPIRSAARHAWAYEHTALRQTVAGLQFANPIGLSAGFDKNLELCPLMKSIGFGFMEGGSITYESCAGNPRPWFHRLPNSQSIVVHAGLANQGAAEIINRLEQYPAATFADFPLNISVAKTNSPRACSQADAISDYLGSLHALKAAGVGDMYTLNISCPNTYGGEPFTWPERLDALLAAVDELYLERPVFIKMPSHLPWPKFHGLAEVAARHHIAGLTISNLAHRDTTTALADPLPEHIPGNLSGRPTFALSNALIAHTRRTFGDRFAIIGVGGVFSAEDAYLKIRLGADLVELITGLIYRGPSLIGEINRGLVERLSRDGFANVAEAVGSGL